jgi:hypothetical protein
MRSKLNRTKKGYFYKMKILNEAKENLPISFLTDFISKG